MPDSGQTALITTRLALHQLAEQVISPVRQRATGGRLALESRPGGFGTHDLPGGGWAGISGTVLLDVAADGATRRQPLTTLRAAATFFGAPDAADLPTTLLDVHTASAARVADAFAGGTQALERLIDAAVRGDEPSGIDLWPEHFDVAITLGSEAAGRRATYGVSPGDEQHAEPYAYVAPWALPDAAAGTPGWDAAGFVGASVPYASAVETLAFFQDRRAALEQLTGGAAA